jgi:Uma2 family endonuclease
MSLALTRERIEETVAQYVYSRPITFDEWLETGDNVLTELVNGTPVEKPMVQLAHEKLILWLLHVLGLYARRTGIGTVLGTRSPVRITAFQGRLPDLFFVRTAHEAFITEKATRGAPDLVIEIVSPNDRKSDTNATEADYQTLGVAEIVYIDLQRQRLRTLRKTDAGYTAETLQHSPLTLATMNGITLNWDWLFTEPRPDEIDLVLALQAKAVSPAD